MSATEIAKVAVGIEANDRSAKGIGSAQKRFDGLGKKASKVGGDIAGNKSSGLRGLIKSIGEIHDAATKAFGARSPLSGFFEKAGSLRKLGSSLGTSLGRASVQLGEVGEAGEIAAGGLGEAASAAGGLTAAAGAAVTVVGGVAVAALAAAAAGYKFADGWATGTAEMGRFAQTVGIGVKNLQELQGAAERYGIKKDAAQQAVGGFSSIVHDAEKGRNPGARNLLNRLGVRFVHGADGNLDYGAMMLQTADAMKRQRDPQAALNAANILGVASLLPMLRQGSAQMRADMADIDKHGVMSTDRDVQVAMRFKRGKTRLDQFSGRVRNRVLAGITRPYAAFVDDTSNATLGHVGTQAAATPVGRPASSVPHATARPPATVFVRRPAAAPIGAVRAAAPHAAGRFTAAQIGQLARRAIPLRDEALPYFNGDEAAATGFAANEVLESGGRTHAAEHTGAGRGIMQVTDAARKRQFQRVMGVDIEHASRAQQLRFAAIYERQQDPYESRMWRRALSQGRDPASIAAGITRFVERPKDISRDSAERAAVAAAIPIHLTVEFKNAPPGTTAKATSRGGAVSYALEPVHGG